MDERPEVVRWDEPGALNRLAAKLLAGEIAAVPTETVYGLSCRALAPDALARLAAVKRLDRPRGFVALAASIEMVELWVRGAPRALAFLRATWPAPLTAVLRVERRAPWGEERGDGSMTAAFRVPAHPRLLDLVNRVGEPVVSTSANRTGRPPLADASAIAGEFGAELDLIVVESTRAGGPASAPDGLQPSTVGDFTVWPPRLLRPGKFDLEASVRAWSGS